MNIYVASSWRNEQQPHVVERLRAEGHDVYDFRYPVEGNDGFAWAAIDEGWESWTMDKYFDALNTGVAMKGFAYDMDALQACDVLVLVLPCGRSAHLEAGYAVADNKLVAILFDEMAEPELMYNMVDCLAENIDQVVDWLAYEHIGKIYAKAMLEGEIV